MSGAKATAGVIEFSGANTPGWISNLGISLATGTLTVVDAQGAALSASNPGWVTVPSTTAGRLATLKVTAPASFNDDAHASASNLTNLGYGITETVGWAADMPFFIYVVNRANSNIDGVDGSSVFALARNPCLDTSSSSANDIGDTGTIPVNDNQNVILIMDDVTVANYTSLPMQLVGCLRMQWSTVSDDWTVQTLSNTDGFGETQLVKTFSKRWTMPLGQNGAAASSHILANNGTAPDFSTAEYVYELDRFGHCTIEVNLSGDGGTDGAGAVEARLALPTLVPAGTISQLRVPLGYTNGATTITSGQILFGAVAENTSYVGLRYLDAAAIWTQINNAMYSNGSRDIQAKFTYNAFLN